MGKNDLKIASSGFTENVLKLVTGNVLAQGLAILVAPVVTRIFAPEAFGVAAIFASITGIIGVLSCLRYEIAIMLPKTEDEAANLLGVSLCISILITVLTAAFILFCSDIIVNLFRCPQLKIYLWLIPITVMLSGVFLALTYWNSRTKNFGRLSIAQVISSITTQTVKLTAGFAGFVGGGVLIGSSILGQFVSTAVLGKRIWCEDRQLFLKAVSRKKMISGFKRYKKFPIFTTWALLLNAGSNHVPIWILAYFFTPIQIGFYALTRAILGMPASLVGGAIAQVFLQKAAEAKNHNDDLSDVVENVFKRLVSLGIFPFLLLSLIGREAFVYIFGTEWAEAGVYVQLLSLSIFFSFVASPISTLFSILEKQGSAMIYNIIFFATRSVAMIVGGIVGDARLTVGLFAAAGIACYFLLFVWLFSSIGISLMRPLLCFGKYTLYCLPFLMITALAKWTLELNSLGVLIIGCLGAIPYYILILKENKRLQNLLNLLLYKFGLYRQVKGLIKK